VYQLPVPACQPVSPTEFPMAAAAAAAAAGGAGGGPAPKVAVALAVAVAGKVTPGWLPGELA